MVRWSCFARVLGDRRGFSTGSQGEREEVVGCRDRSGRIVGWARSGTIRGQPRAGRRAVSTASGKHHGARAPGQAAEGHEARELADVVDAPVSARSGRTLPLRTCSETPASDAGCGELASRPVDGGMRTSIPELCGGGWRRVGSVHTASDHACSGLMNTSCRHHRKGADFEWMMTSSIPGSCRW